MARTSISIQITGLDETIRNFRTMASGVVPVLAAALNQEHEVIMTKAKERTPVLTGALRASGHVVPPVILTRTIKSIGAFGGTAAPYAVAVHEDLNAFHHVGRAKFYESAVREQRAQVRTAAKDAVHRYIASRAGG
jgi:hypothetical protein